MRKKFNERLKELREDNDYTQTKVAKDLNIDQRSISFYEKGKFEPNIETLINFSIYFNVSVDYLLGLTNEKKIYLRAI